MIEQHFAAVVDFLLSVEIFFGRLGVSLRFFQLLRHCILGGNCVLRLRLFKVAALFLRGRRIAFPNILRPRPLGKAAPLVIMSRGQPRER